MTEFQSKPMVVNTLTNQQTFDDFSSRGGEVNEETSGNIQTIILHYLLRMLTLLSDCYTGWREFEDDLIVYSKSTRTKQLVSSFILLLLLIITIWVYKKLKIF